MDLMTRDGNTRRIIQDEGLLTSLDLIEPDGTIKTVFLTSGAAVGVYNPRLHDPDTRMVLTALTDLCDFHDLRSPKDCMEDNSSGPKTKTDKQCVRPSKLCSHCAVSPKGNLKFKCGLLLLIPTRSVECQDKCMVL